MPISKCLWRKPPKEKSNKRRYESEDQQRFNKRIKSESEEETNENQDEELTLFTSQTPFERQIQIRVTAPKKDQDSAAVWYPEDDELLMSLTKKYQYNWDLIADAWNSSRGLITGYERSPWDCYMRWTQKDDMSQFIINHYNDGVSEESTVEVLIDNASDATGVSMLNMRPKREMPKNIQKRDITKPRRNSSLAEAMKKAAKKRADSSQKQLQNRRNHDQPTPIMHHVMTPIELSKMKSDQERQIQTALLEQRQAAVLAFQGHTRQPMVARPPTNPAMQYFTAQTRPPTGIGSSQLQAFVQQQQQQQRAAAMVQHRHHPQQLAQTMATQFYNAQFRQAHAQQRNQLLQGAVIPNPMVPQQIVQQQVAAARQQQAQMPQQSTQQTQNIQQTQENVSQSQQST